MFNENYVFVSFVGLQCITAEKEKRRGDPTIEGKATAVQFPGREIQLCSARAWCGNGGKLKGKRMKVKCLEELYWGGVCSSLQAINSGSRLLPAEASGRLIFACPFLLLHFFFLEILFPIYLF